jgi:hypothetical protein
VGPVALTRRLWGWFELLPFRRGMVLLAAVIAVPALLAGGVLALGGGSDDKAAPRPSVSRSPVEAAVPPATTLGTYVPPQRHAATDAPPRPRTAPSNPSPRTRTTRRAASPSPNPAACPDSLKRWPWAWNMCRRKPHDHRRS